MRPLLGVLLLVALAACEGLGVGGSVDVETVPFVRVSDGFAYSAKFLCGTIQAAPGSPEFPDASRDTAAVLVPGTYLTSVNVHNPDTITVVLWKRPVEAKGQRMARGRVGEMVGDTLTADQGLYVDCADILRLLRDRRSLQDHFLEGFVVIRNRTELRVTAVYSFKNVDGRSR